MNITSDTPTQPDLHITFTHEEAVNLKRCMAVVEDSAHCPRRHRLGFEPPVGFARDLFNKLQSWKVFL